MTTTTAYVLGALLAWPVLTFGLAFRLNHLRRGPKLSTVATLAAIAAVAWPLALAALFVAPRPRSRP